MLLNFGDLDPFSFCPSSTVQWCKRGCVGGWPSANSSPQFPLLPGNGHQHEREVGAGRTDRQTAVSVVRDWRVPDASSEWEAAGGVCSSSFHLSSWWLQTCIKSSLLGWRQSHFHPTDQSVWWGHSEIARVTLVQGCSETSLSILVVPLHRGLLKVLWPVCLLIFVIGLELPSTPNFIGMDSGNVAVSSRNHTSEAWCSPISCLL